MNPALLLNKNPAPLPGAVIKLRSVTWKVLGKTVIKQGLKEIHCQGIGSLVRNKEARFIWELEKDAHVMDPAAVKPVPDMSPGLIDTKLYLESAFRNTPTTTRTPLTLGRAAIDDLSFQHLPVERALAQDRVRLLIADDVGLGKTLEAGLITSELALRGRANRILVISTRAMLTQFQKEFWTRFSIPLSRLDSAAIHRMRTRIPAHYNVFNQFDRSIVSIDTLKRDTQIRDAIKRSYWDLIIIDEAHNAAARKSSLGSSSQRAELAQLLSRCTDSLLLLTATPHDGSRESFASLIEMLDPTRVPDPSKLQRVDIEDLVVRRFRSDKKVMTEISEQVPERELFRRNFPLSEKEEVAYRSIADLQFDDDGQPARGRSHDLFRTTLAKAIFSSPAACLETIRRRIAGVKNGTSSGTAVDLERLEGLASHVEAINTADFSKYRNLLKMFQEMKWTGKKPRDRIVIFSERIRTVSWLAERLRKDLNLSKFQVVQVDGGSVEADTRIQEVIDDFGQRQSPIRILIASDMASEGLNLHFQCHRLIHFDLPWSLLRFQQRNGRIDRYGQDRTPEITYLVGDSTHPKVQQMWVLEKLVEKDRAAQAGIGDPAVFLGMGDAEKEEKEVMKVVASNIGAEEFERQMDDRAAKAQEQMSLDDEFSALFGDYANSTGTEKPNIPVNDDLPPRLFRDTFSYAGAMLTRLSESSERIFSARPDVSEEKRVIEFTLPDDMRVRNMLGSGGKGSVDGRFMPVESVGAGDLVKLTDRKETIIHAVNQSKIEERSWPDIQYLWDGHPVLNWFADRANEFFPEHCAPVARLDSLLQDEVAVIIHGIIPNESGTPVVDRWAVVVKKPDGDRVIENVADFIARTELDKNTPVRSMDNVETLEIEIRDAVSQFQTHLYELGKTRAELIEREIDEVLEDLGKRQAEFVEQLELDLGKIPDDSKTLSSSEKRRRTIFKRKEGKINQIFDDWLKWHNRTREIVNDPNPHVHVKAIFSG